MTSKVAKGCCPQLDVAEVVAPSAALSQHGQCFRGFSSLGLKTSGLCPNIAQLLNGYCVQQAPEQPNIKERRLARGCPAEAPRQHLDLSPKTVATSPAAGS